MGSINKAIEVGEEGLKLADEKEELLLPKFYNSLAYYYADGDRMDREQDARIFASKAALTRTNETQPRDTEGYVMISFGKTPAEIQADVALCHDAMCKGTPFEYYAKHIAKAHVRLESFRKKEEA